MKKKKKIEQIEFQFNSAFFKIVITIISFFKALKIYQNRENLIFQLVKHNYINDLLNNLHLNHVYAIFIPRKKISVLIKKLKIRVRYLKKMLSI